jgi:hypothetical protein
MKRILEVILFTVIMPLILIAQNPIVKSIYTSNTAKWCDQISGYFGQSTSVQLRIQSDEATQLNGSIDICWSGNL